jgi:hypothetical protein
MIKCIKMFNDNLKKIWSTNFEKCLNAKIALYVETSYDKSSKEALK